MADRHFSAGLAVKTSKVSQLINRLFKPMLNPDKMSFKICGAVWFLYVLPVKSLSTASPTKDDPTTRKQGSPFR